MTDQRELCLIYEGVKNKFKQYPIQVPPSTKAECIKLLKKTDMAKESWFMNKGGKDVEMSFDDAVKDWDIATVRHETVHALQEINIPGIFKGLPELSHKFGDSEEYKKKHYYNRPPEIMAYAYDTAMGVDSAKNKRTFKDMGGKVYELFLHYVEEYEKALH